MQKKMLKKIIIRLIKDDLKHRKLIDGLNLLGFKNDKAELNISSSIFDLMGLNLNDKRLDHISKEYFNLTYTINDFPGKDTESSQRLVVEIYNWLSLERKKYQKKIG